MNPEIPTFLEYEKRMEALRSEYPHLWSIRDLIYRYLAKTAKTKDIWWSCYFSLLFQLINSVFRNRKFSFVWPQRGPRQASHFIFLNSAPNHFARIYPLFLKQSKNGQAVGWVADMRVLPLMDKEHRAKAMPLSNFNLWCARPTDPFKAWKDVKQIKKIFPEFRQTRFPPAIFFILLKYYSMSRFWEFVFTNTPNAVYTTFEKDIAAKAVMESAYMAGCPERIHCLHGLFHPSLAPTFASEMWCMTDKEAESAKRYLPTTCKAKCKMSDEFMRLRHSVGVIDQEGRGTVTKPHILVLGTSTDPTYNIDMRIEDLCVVRSLMQSTKLSYEWRFRPHPGAIEPYRKELESAGIHVDDFSLRKLDEDLQWTHVVITPFSSVGLDAHNLGRIVLWNQAQNRNLFDIDQLVSDGFGSRIDITGFQKAMLDRFPNSQIASL